MSALTRLSSLSGSVNLWRASALQLRRISTSKKQQETATINPTTAVDETKIKSDIFDPEKNWVSYGFNFHDKEEDRHMMHVVTFMGVTVCLVFGGVALAYRPDDLGRDWAQREAYLELRRREKLGLPPVDPNYIPLDQIWLPTDEELGDTEVVI
ncbi:unnamed protein product [Nesidiocoris tenuis]|uniref:NADH dehydrogenase [ubiquinone] 1 beta subcomplex subunit 11, mitochondrial n=1 Tax=Nesidiocoris tenuis TaxID=355587 RepID=A0A6H5GH81_9HEMI|nr:unnamed protein product [Nesidiocoris tenuis]CAB0002045.1 unnamed protein product [Nesidiocoris tenuis]